MKRKTTTYTIQGKASFQSKISGGACFACVVVRRFLLFLLLSALLTPLSTLFSACGHDDLVPPDVYVEDHTPYVEIHIAVPLANPYSTRANPMGGEEGNGREQGLLNEDLIRDINVFFYIEERKKNENGEDEKDVLGRPIGLGMDSDENTEIIKHIYYNLRVPTDPANTPNLEVESNSDKNSPIYLDNRYVTLRFECSADEMQKVKETGIDFVAIANIGPIQDQFLEATVNGKKIMTLGKLREIDIANDLRGNTWFSYDVCSKRANKMDYFLMSTAYNNIESSKYGTNKISTPDTGDIYTGTTTLQRLYARLDLWYNKTDNAITESTGNNEVVSELQYQVVDKDGDPIKDENENVVKNKVYLTNVLPVNVMQQPSYIFKKVTNITDEWDTNRNFWNQNNLYYMSNFKWGGKENPDGSDFTVTTSNDRPKNYVMEWHTTDKRKEGTGDLNTWYGTTKVEDVKVNILDTTKGKLSDYYDCDPNSESNPNYGCNHISIISYANENTHPTDCFHSNYLTGMAFRAVYVPDEEKIFSDYDKGTNTLTKLDQTATSITGGQIFRYSPTTKEQKESKSLYFTSKAKAEDYAIDHPLDMAIISEGYTAEKHTLADGTQKWGFICYYNLWLRHYNNEAGDPTENYPMEYATVRNNIYRVAVSFRGPGDPTPTMREPDTMKARIFVRKWNYREEDILVYD